MQLVIDLLIIFVRKIVKWMVAIVLCIFVTSNVRDFTFLEIANSRDYISLHVLLQTR